MYFITVMTKPKKGSMISDESRCWGFYPNLSQAKNAVENNITDLWETIYDYAVIEIIRPGIAYPAEIVQWYKYRIGSKKYEPVNEPKWAKNICNFAIG